MASQANENILARGGWVNGSLNDSRFAAAWHPAGSRPQSVNLTILPDDLALLSFAVTDTQNFVQILAVARTILSQEYYSDQIRCTYPLSGNYEFLMRLLFYILMLFALLYRRHTWLAITALAIAMTYSATAAVHAFALLTQFEYTEGPPNLESSQSFGDVDLAPMFTILTASPLLLTPILTWSTNVRRDKAQIIVVLWGLLIFVAWVPVAVQYSIRPNGDRLHPWNFNVIPALVSCSRAAARDDISCVPGRYLTLEVYTNCDCFDFCSLMGSVSPMRKGATMVPILPTEAIYKHLTSPSFILAEYLTSLAGVIIALYGAFGLLHNQFSLREMRDLILRVGDTHPQELRSLWRMVRDPNQKSRTLPYVKESSRTGMRKMQYELAKGWAMIFFFLGVFMAITCPLILVSVVITLELDLQSIPTSEGSDAIGAWDPWVGAAFVFLVALILHYHNAWELALMSMGNWALRQMRIHIFEDTNPAGGGWSIFFIEQVRRPFSHAIRSTRRAFRTSMFAWREMIVWAQAPAPHCQLCGCDGCMQCRALARASRTLVDHSEHCSCPACTTIKDVTRNISANCAHNHKSCGCLACAATRKHSIVHAAAKSSEEIIHFKTLSMRILQKYDDRISDLLDQAHALPSQNQQAQSPGRVSTAATRKRDRSSSAVAEEPLLTARSMSLQPHDAPPAADTSGIEMDNIFPAKQSA